MILHSIVFWKGVLCAPVIWFAFLYFLHLIQKLILIWIKLLRGNPIKHYCALLAVAWGLPRLTKEYCFFEKRGDRFWFSPRMEKFKIIQTPQDKGQ